MKKIYLAAITALSAITVTACGTISPPVQTPPETAVTETAEITAESIVPTETSDISEEEQINSNAFIAEFFDSSITFTDTNALVKESMKGCTFENQIDASNGIQKVSLKSSN